MDCCKKAALAQEPRLLTAVAPETTNSSERFKHVVSDEQLSELSKGYTPKNTEASRTSAISDLGLFIVLVSCHSRASGAAFAILRLCNESCASTVDSTDIA